VGGGEADVENSQNRTRGGRWGPIVNKMSLAAFPGLDHEIRRLAKANSKQGLRFREVVRVEVKESAGTLLFYVNKTR